MTLTKGDIALSVVCVLAGILLGAGFRSCSQTKQPAPDPVVIHDTIEVSNPADIEAHSKPKYVIKRDTMWLPRPVSPCDSVDSLCDGRVTDSIPVDIPIMAYEYRDTFQTDTSRIELGIRYEGYKAKIDGIDLQYRFESQPRIIEKKKGWGQFIGVGIGVGYGASVVGQTVYAAPEIGVHITYGWGYHW